MMWHWIIGIGLAGTALLGAAQVEASDDRRVVIVCTDPSHRHHGYDQIRYSAPFARTGPFRPYPPAFDTYFGQDRFRSYPHYVHPGYGRWDDGPRYRGDRHGSRYRQGGGYGGRHYDRHHRDRGDYRYDRYHFRKAIPTDNDRNVRRVPHSGAGRYWGDRDD